MTYLVKVTNQYRVPSVQDALNLRQELQDGPGELNSFSYTTKYIKASGEIVDEYQQVKATIIFNEEKECEDEIREHYE